MTPGRLSIREFEVLSAIARCDTIGLQSLALHFESRFPEDECERVVESLHKKKLVALTPGGRTTVITMLTDGRRALRESGQ